MADTNILSSVSTLIVKEQQRGPAEYILAGSNNINSDLLFVREADPSSCTSCCPRHHSFTYHLHAGKRDGALLAEYKRNCKFPMLPCKPCLYQTLYVIDGKTKEELGWVREEFWVTVPTFSVRDQKNNVLIYIHYKTCCTGLFYDCPKEGMCSCACTCCALQPFFMYPVNPITQRESEESDGSFRHTLTSPTSLLGSASPTFEIQFPTIAPNSAREKTLYLGAAWLINELYFAEKTCCPSFDCKCLERVYMAMFLQRRKCTCCFG